MRAMHVLVVLVGLCVTAVGAFNFCSSNLASSCGKSAPWCTQIAGRNSRRGRGDREVVRFKAISTEYQRLRRLGFRNPVSRCRYDSKCEKRTVTRYCCGNCLILWPPKGIRNVRCRPNNARCKLPCGCSGRCRQYGPRSVKALLFCPGQWPLFRWKTFTVCTNCCCCV